MTTIICFHKILGFVRDILVMLVAIMLLGLDKDLWVSFMPDYLEVLGAGVLLWQFTAH